MENTNPGAPEASKKTLRAPRSGWRSSSAKVAIAALFLSALAFIFIFFIPDAKSSGPAVRGELDASSWGASLIPLSGEWEVMESSQPAQVAGAPYAVLPKKWDRPSGYAVYRLKLRGLDPAIRYALRLQYMDTSFRLLADGKEIMAGGSPGRTARTTKSAYRTGVARLPDGIAGIELANFVHLRGGPSCPIVLGPEKAVEDMDAVNVLINAAIVCVLAILGLLCLFNAALRASAASAFFGLLCIGGSVAFFAISPDALVYRFLPDLPWTVYVRIVFMAVIPAPLMILLASRSLFGGIKDRTALGLSLPVALAVLIALLAPLPALNALYPAILCYGFFLFALCLAVHIRALRHGYPHAGIFLAGNVVIVLECLSIALYSQGKVGDSPFMVLSFLYAIFDPGRGGRIALGVLSCVIALLPLNALSALLFIDSASRRIKAQPGSEGRAAGARGKCVQLGLSPRETDVVMLALEGKRNKEISDSLFISVNTVKTHLSKAFFKAGIKARSELFAYFHS
jgi:DNA-binding CsgD family transcriptional regulator